MKRAVAALAFVLAACTSTGPLSQISTSPSPGNQISTSPSSGYPVLPSSTPPPYQAGTTPSPGNQVSPSVPSSPLAVVVDPNPDGSNVHTLYLIGSDGHIYAQATATNRTTITSWPANSPILNLWSDYATASGTRAYYLDGDNSVRYLDQAGRTGEVAQVPGGTHSRSFFSVSPDDRQIAVTVFDYSAPPIVQMEFYVQDLTTGVKSPIPTHSYFWPIGWHSGNIVVQAGNPIPQSQYAAYSEGADSIQVIDRTSGSTRATLGGPGCRPVPSLATPVGLVCVDSSSETFHVIGWDGKAVAFSGRSGPALVSLSTDGRWVATSIGQMAVTGSPAEGSQFVSTGLSGFPGEAGWIDSTHFMYREAGSPKEAIYDITSRSSTSLSFTGILVARIPGNL